MLYEILVLICIIFGLGSLTGSSNQSGGSSIYNMIKGGGKSRKGKG